MNNEFRRNQVRSRQSAEPGFRLRTSGGNSVMTARALYALIDHSKHYNDQELCQLDGITLKQAQQTGSKPKCNLFPNPANESVTLTYQFVSDSQGILTLHNLVGQEIFKHDLNGKESSFKFSTAQLVPGVYYLNIRQKSEIIDNLKLVIIR